MPLQWETYPSPQPGLRGPRALATTNLQPRLCFPTTPDPLASGPLHKWSPLTGVPFPCSLLDTFLLGFRYSSGICPLRKPSAALRWTGASSEIRSHLRCLRNSAQTGLSAWRRQEWRGRKWLPDVDFTLIRRGHWEQSLGHEEHMGLAHFSLSSLTSLAPRGRQWGWDSTGSGGSHSPSWPLHPSFFLLNSHSLRESSQVLLICVLASSGEGRATGHLKKEDKPNGPHSVPGTVLNP